MNRRQEMCNVLRGCLLKAGPKPQQQHTLTWQHSRNVDVETSPDTTETGLRVLDKKQQSVVVKPFCVSDTE